MTPSLDTGFVLKGLLLLSCSILVYKVVSASISVTENMSEPPKEAVLEPEDLKDMLTVEGQNLALAIPPPGRPTNAPISVSPNLGRLPAEILEKMLEHLLTAKNVRKFALDPE